MSTSEPIVIENFTSVRAAEPVGLFPHAKRVGHLLFCSGIGPRERGTKAIPGVTFGDDGSVVDHDIEAQTHSVLRNVRYLLEDAGTSFDRIVDVQVFLTSMKRDFAKFNAIWAEYFPDDPPTRTTVEVTALPTPIAIELKVIATIG